MQSPKIWRIPSRSEESVSASTNQLSFDYTKKFDAQTRSVRDQRHHTLLFFHNMTKGKKNNVRQVLSALKLIH